MWDRWKNVIVGRPPDARPVRAAARPLDLFAVPSLPVGHPDGLTAIDPVPLGRYLGQPVQRIEPLSQDLEPSPVPRQPSRGIRHTGWCVVLHSGTTMSIQLRPIDDPRAVFPVLQWRYIAERVDSPDAPQEEDLSLEAVCTVPGAPYETYYQGTVLAARGSRNEALVITCSPAGPLFHQTMAAVASVALRMIVD